MTMDRREPLAVRICGLVWPSAMKSPVMASCIADGGFTVNEYSEISEKLVMTAEVGAGPGDATACRTQACVFAALKNKREAVVWRKTRVEEGGTRSVVVN